MNFTKDDVRYQKRVWNGIPYEVLASNAGKCIWCTPATLEYMPDRLPEALRQGWVCTLGESPVMSDWCTKFHESICPLPEEARNAGRY